MSTTKNCSKCNQLKPVSEYYKCNANPDGLQNWCKTCQAEANKKTQQKKKLQKRNTQLKRFSHYHLNKGLKYKLKGPQKKGSNRQEVTYNCLNCGKEVESTLELAWEHKFKCDDCRLKNTKDFSSYIKSTKKKEEENKNLYNELNSDCHCHSSCSNGCKKTNKNSEPKDIHLENILKHNLDYESSTIFGFHNEPVRVFMIPMYLENQKQEQKKENRFIKWLKGLFGR